MNGIKTLLLIVKRYSQFPLDVNGRLMPWTTVWQQWFGAVNRKDRGYAGK
jgi:hypothetical protein